MNIKQLTIKFLLFSFFFGFTISLILIFTSSSKKVADTIKNEFCGQNELHIDNTELERMLQPFENNETLKNESETFEFKDNLYKSNIQLTKIYENKIIGLFFMPNLNINQNLNLNEKIIKLTKVLNSTEICLEDSLEIIRTKYLCLINSIISNKKNNFYQIYNVLTEIRNKFEGGIFHKIYIVLYSNTSEKNDIFIKDTYVSKYIYFKDMKELDNAFIERYLTNNTVDDINNLDAFYCNLN